MKIPVYKNTDLMVALKEGNYESNDFADFIAQLAEQEDELSFIQIKVVKQVDSEGTLDLTRYEVNALKKLVTRYKRVCNICGAEIPLNEVFHFEGFCSNHKYLKDE